MPFISSVPMQDIFQRVLGPKDPRTLHAREEDRNRKKLRNFTETFFYEMYHVSNLDPGLRDIVRTSCLRRFVRTEKN